MVRACIRGFLSREVERMLAGAHAALEALLGYRGEPHGSDAVHKAEELLERVQKEAREPIGRDTLRLLVITCCCKSASWRLRTCAVALLVSHVGEHAQDTDILESSYAVLFSLLEEPLLPGLCVLLSMLTRRRHVQAFRMWRVLELGEKYPHDRDIYTLIDTYAVYIPNVLIPERRRDVARPDSHISRRVLSNWASCPCPPVHAQFHDLHVDKSESFSLAHRAVHLAYLCGRGKPSLPLNTLDDAYGECLAASLGHILAAAFLQRQAETDTVNDVPLFDPSTGGALEQAATMCERLGEVPPTMFRFLTHVVQSMCVRALQFIDSGEPLHTWEAAWHSCVVDFGRMVAILRWSPWEDVSPCILRPYCYLGTLDGVSDGLSAHILNSLTQLYAAWRTLGEAPALREMILELEQSLLVDGVPSLSLCNAACALHGAFGKVGDPDAGKLAYPLPFYLLVSPVGLSGSIVTLAHVCGMILQLRNSGADTMVLALVELIWSGRAFGVLQQQGVIVDGIVACDGSTFAALRGTVNGPVPFGLVGSLSHGALLAPLFERFVNEILLAPANTHHIFVRVPITPSALRPARNSGLPPHMQYADVRIAFLTWLSKCGAPQILQLLQVFLPSLRSS